MIVYTEGTIPGRAGVGPIAVIQDDTHLSRWIETSRKLDHDDVPGGLLPCIMELIRPGDIVVDGGACLGDHTASYASRARHVHAFEANPETAQALAYNCRGLPVTVHDVGLSDVFADATITTDPNVGASRIVPNGGVSPTRVQRLDAYGLEPNLIKLDIEGYEVKALRGARETIMRCRPILVVEVNSWALEQAGDSVQALADILAEYRYESRDIMYGSPLKGDCQHPLYDVVCRPIA